MLRPQWERDLLGIHHSEYITLTLCVWTYKLPRKIRNRFVPVPGGLMKLLLKDYMDSRISRRSFISGLAALGISASAARKLAAMAAPASVRAQAAAPQNAQWIRQVRGS